MDPDVLGSIPATSELNSGEPSALNFDLCQLLLSTEDKLLKPWCYYWLNRQSSLGTTILQVGAYVCTEQHNFL